MSVLTACSNHLPQLENRVKISMPAMVVHRLSDLSIGLLTRSKLVGGLLCPTVSDHLDLIDMDLIDIATWLVLIRCLLVSSHD